MLVDSHCHLNYDDFKEDFDDVLKRAKQMDVGTLLTISTKLSEADQIIKVAESHDNIFCTIGVHPHDVESEGVVSVEDLIELTKHPKVVGIGETGLDYYYEHSPKEAQKQSFCNHIKAAAKTNLPLVIHSRSAEEDILQLLAEENVADRSYPGVIHCFSGTEDFAKKTMAMNFYISISGIITFKKAEELRHIVQHTVSLDRLLVETDSPYLAPIPHRGKRNEPSFVVHTAEKVAELKQCSLPDLAKATTDNLFTLFSKATRPA
jgi:TatD DNase family protein